MNTRNQIYTGQEMRNVQDFIGITENLSLIPIFHHFSSFFITFPPLPSERSQTIKGPEAGHEKIDM